MCHEVLVFCLKMGFQFPQPNLRLKNTTQTSCNTAQLMPDKIEGCSLPCSSLEIPSEHPLPFSFACIPVPMLCNRRLHFPMRPLVLARLHASARSSKADRTLIPKPAYPSASCLSAIKILQKVGARHSTRASINNWSMSHRHTPWLMVATARAPTKSPAYCPSEAH